MASTDSSPGQSQCLYDILPTPYGGRGAFARSTIPKGTHVLLSTAPYAMVHFWKFRREVCAWCFAYSFESGKSKWSVKLALDAKGSGGIWFCSEACRDLCIHEYELEPGHGMDWWLEINAGFEKLLLQNGKIAQQQQQQGAPVLDQSPAVLAYLDNAKPEDITQEFIDKAWALAEEVALAESKLAWKDELNELEIDSAKYVLDGLIRKSIEETNPAAPMLTRCADDATTYCLSGGQWRDYLDLQDNELPLVKSKPYMLVSRIRIYRFLRYLSSSLFGSKKQGRASNGSSTSRLTGPIRDHLRKSLSTHAATRALMARDYGNVFGIWDMTAEDAGSEMLGWAACVHASYFNHDCSPNIKKTRDKRGIRFYTLRDVNPGEELCISYINFSSVEERIEQLERDWFFTCQCRQCEKDLSARRDVLGVENSERRIDPKANAEQ